MFFQKNSKKLKLCLVIGLVLIGSILIKWFDEYTIDSVAINTENNFVENNTYSNLWMCPIQSPYSSDYMNLFSQDGQWKNARSRVDVFQFYRGNIYGNSQMKDSDLSLVISKLNQWDIDMSIEAPVIKEWHNGGCDASAPFDLAVRTINRVQNHNGVVKYIAMQEPLFSAHKQQGGCGHTIEKAAEISVNHYINDLKMLFPNVIIGDIEPYPAISINELKQWIIALESNGYKLPFFNLDVNANRSDVKLSEILDLQNFCQNRGIQFGMIFWPNDQSISGQLADSDKDLYQGVMRWGKQIYSNVGAPDIAVVQSWEKRFVQRNLPDNSGYSFAQLVKDFANTYIPITATCADTDGGYNIYEKGTACSSFCKTDVCLSPISLKEYYCNGSTMMSKTIACEYGCVDGACKQQSSEQQAQGERHLCISGLSTATGTYSPYVRKETGWDRYIMLFHSNPNNVGDGVNRDRIFYAEHSGDGISKSGWNVVGTPIIMPESGGGEHGESGLIGDPAFVHVNGVWHVYYSGAPQCNDFDVMCINNIFHATGTNIFNLSKQGIVQGIARANYAYGKGEASVIYENGKFKLFYFDSADSSTHLAESSDGHNFNYIGRVTPDITLNPSVTKQGNEYVLVFSGFDRILISKSNNPNSFPPATEVFWPRENEWDFGHVFTPDYLNGRIYYGSGTHSMPPSNNSTIGVYLYEDVSTPICADTDGGQNIYEKGTTCATFCRADTCVSSTSLKEYYCNGNTMMSKTVACAYGCVDGACLQLQCQSNHTDSAGKCHHDCGTSAGCHGKTPNSCSTNPLKKCNSNCQEISSCGDGICNCKENLNNCQEDCEGNETLSTDLNCDGSVNLTDSAILMSFWGKDPSGAVSCQNPDINQNGAVNLTDFGIMMSQWTVF